MGNFDTKIAKVKTALENIFLKKTDAANTYQPKGNYATSNHTHTTGSITDFPTIPTKTSDLSNDSGFLTSHQTIPTGTTSTAGIVQLEDSYSSTSTTKAATPNAVKAAYDLANGKAASSHNHGAITSEGVLINRQNAHAMTNVPVKTDSNGFIVYGSFGTSANTFCEGNDSRLSDARTPTAHTQASSTITDMSTVQVVVTYTDNTSETLTLFKQI